MWSHVTFYIPKAHIYTHHDSTQNGFLVKAFSKHVNALMTGCVFVCFANQVFQLVWPIRSALEKHVQLIHYYCWHKIRLESLGWSLWSVYRHKSDLLCVCLTFFILAWHAHHVSTNIPLHFYLRLKKRVQQLLRSVTCRKHTNNVMHMLILWVNQDHIEDLKPLCQ